MTDTVIFDLDGTLLDTLADLTDSVNHAMRQFGFPVHTLEEVRSFVGNGASKLMERSIPRGVENPSYEAALKAFKEYYAGHCEDKTKPYEGVMEMLETLKGQGYRLAVVSNKFDGAVKRLCRKYFEGYITAAIGESDKVKRKPAPDTVYQALRELGSDVSQAVYVGDSDVDIRTAGNVPMPCISVTWGFRTEEQLKKAGACDGGADLLRESQAQPPAAKSVIIRTPQELPALLLRLLGEG